MSAVTFDHFVREENEERINHVGQQTPVCSCLSRRSYLAVRIDIIDIECETQFIANIAVRIDVYCQEKFGEVNVAVVIRVERSKHLRTVLFRFVFRVEFLVDFGELSRGKTSVRTITEKSFVPLSDLFGRIIGVARQTIDHVTGQINSDNFTSFTSHRARRGAKI